MTGMKRMLFGDEGTGGDIAEHDSGSSLSKVKKMRVYESVGDEELVPITLLLNVDGTPVRDTFLWNLYEKDVSPKAFAINLCGDLDLPNQFADVISENITDQLAAYRKQVVIHSKPTGPENRCLIQLNVTINSITLRDRFEWDLCCTEAHNSPEAFAISLCSDLGLPRDFEFAVAHSIREQLAAHRSKSSDEIQSPIERPVRNPQTIAAWTPTVDFSALEEEDEKRSRYRFRRRNASKISLEARAAIPHLPGTYT